MPNYLEILRLDKLREGGAHGLDLGETAGLLSGEKFQYLQAEFQGDVVIGGRGAAGENGNVFLLGVSKLTSLSIFICKGKFLLQRMKLKMCLFAGTDKQIEDIARLYLCFECVFRMPLDAQQEWVIGTL